MPEFVINPFTGDFDAVNSTSNPVDVADGGTGRNTLTAHAFLIGDGTNPVAFLGPGTNGQIPIGSTGATPVLATITAGAGISVTNAAGSITIANTSAGFTWNTVAGTSQTIAAQNGYINANAGLTTYLLPAVAAVGDTFQLAGRGAGGWILTQNAGQVIHFNSSDTTVGVGGSLASTNRYNTIEVMCIVANTDWTVLDSSGTLTVV